MKFFVFNFDTCKHMISSFLESASLAHNKEKNNEDWFYWKFRDNPFGESIIVCAEDESKIVGCVAYGIQEFWLNDEKIRGVLSFETFVHPAFQGKGIFSNLVQLGEETVKSKGFDLMLNFPNSNSLRGFIKAGWKSIEGPEYWIKGKNLWNVLFNYKHICLGFKPNKSNINLLTMPKGFKQNTSQQVTSVITADYLRWRFFTYPVTEYVVVDSKDFYSIIRMGSRGKSREGQVLFIQTKISDGFKINDFIKDCKVRANFDILSFSISKTNKIRNLLKKSFFLKVPNKANICYKILNEAIIKEEDVRDISLNAINYHTY